MNARKGKGDSVCLSIKMIYFIFSLSPITRQWMKVLKEVSVECLDDFMVDGRGGSDLLVVVVVNVLLLLLLLLLCQSEMSVCSFALLCSDGVFIYLDTNQ